MLEIMKEYSLNYEDYLETPVEVVELMKYKLNIDREWQQKSKSNW